MTTYLAPQFNGYPYVGVEDCFDTYVDGVGAKLRIADPPEVDGGFTAGGLVAARKFSIKGLMTISPSGVVQTDAASFRGLQDNFTSVHSPGTPQPFWMNSDRYINAEPESVSFPQWYKGLPNFPYQVDFLASDPFWYQGDAYSPQSNTMNLDVGGASPPAENTSQTPTPVTGPTVAPAAGSTALAAGTYLVAYTYTDTSGETQISPTSSVTITAGEQIAVSALALPSGVTTGNLYLSIAAGSSTLAWAATWNGSAADITALPTSPNSTTVTPTGTVYSLPVLSIDVSSAPAGSLVYVSVTGGGITWAFMFAPQATGTYVVDCTVQQQRVTLAGADVTSSIFFQGTFPRLAVGANTVVMGLSGGAAVSSATCAYQNRWLSP